MKEPMNNQSMTVPPSSYRRGRNISHFIAALALTFAASQEKLPAQDLPPLPEPGFGIKLTPEE